VQQTAMNWMAIPRHDSSLKDWKRDCIYIDVKRKTKVRKIMSPGYDPSEKIA
jgi:hypothetical protein